MTLTGPTPSTTSTPPPWTAEELTERFRAVAAQRYHHRHPFNLRMHAGELSVQELRGWIRNRFHYQRHIPIKDALIMSQMDDPALRRGWVRRIHDHDGAPGIDAAGEQVDEGGIERWLRLGEAAGLDREHLRGGEDVLPGVRLAVESYVDFCRRRPLLEAVASSLTEMFAPDLMRSRTEAFESHYRWIHPDGLAYFRSRVTQGERDSREALDLVLRWATGREAQARAVAALEFKCDVLWSLLDAVAAAYSPDR